MSKFTKRLCFCAMGVALAVVTSFIRLFKMPFGGSITLCSMLFIMLPGWFYGFTWGAVCGLVFGLIQFLIEPCFVTIPQFIFDYILAFAVMGTGGLFRNRRHSLLISYIVAVIGRWIIAGIAGLIWVSLGFMAWSNWSPLPYSYAYNALYIFPEAIVTVIVILIPAVSKTLNRVRQNAVG